MYKHIYSLFFIFSFRSPVVSFRFFLIAKQRGFCKNCCKSVNIVVAMACCPPGSYGALKTDPSNCSGEVLQVGDLPVYLTGKGKEEKPSSAMVVFYDIFGFQGHSRIREICDFLAENTGLRVYMADYYHGEQVRLIYKYHQRCLCFYNILFDN